jgi:hypothetical protein
MPKCNHEQLRGAGTRQVPLQVSGNDSHSLHFLRIQRKCLYSDGVTFSRCFKGVTESRS